MDSQIQEVLAAILGTSNDHRKQAEQLIDQLHETNPQKLFEALVVGLALPDARVTPLSLL